MTVTPEPTPDPAEEIVFRCLESGDPGAELAAVERRDPGLAVRARKLLSWLDHDGLLHPADAAPGLPERLGPYRLEGRLGEGGMGLVVAATDTELNRRVAVKLVRPEMLPFGKSRQRFENEIRALAKLHHPGIAQVLRAGEESGLRYYAMELVDGESLAQILGRLRERDPDELVGRDLFAGGLERVDAGTSERNALLGATWVEACMRIVRDTAVALAHAHEHGILHRDVKPGNVMLGRDGRVRLLDFGLAQADDAQTMTRSGAAIGSLAYMAPEQLLGDRDSVDSRVDVYGLGVLLYELLTLRSPFLVEDSEEATHDRILAGRAASPRRRNGRVDRRLASVCARAMARRLGARTATAGLFARELDTLLVDRPGHPRMSLQLLVQRRPLAVASAGLCLLAGAIVLAIALALALQSRDELRTENASLSESAAAARQTAQGVSLASYSALLEVARGHLADARLADAEDALLRAPAEHRSWEWDWLARRARLDATLHRPPLVSGAWNMAAAPERLVFSYRSSNRLSVVELPSGRARTLATTGLPRARHARLSVDGSTFALIPMSAESLVLVDVVREQVRAFPLRRGGAVVGLSPDGSRAAVGHPDGSATLFDADTGDEVSGLEDARGSEWSDAGLVFSPDSRWLCGALRNGELLLWNLEANVVQWRRRVAAGAVSWLGFDPDGEHLWTVAQLERLNRWQTLTGELVTELGFTPSIRQSHNGRILWRGLPNGEHFWAVGFDGLARCLHVPTERWLVAVPGFDVSKGRNPWLRNACIDRHRGRLLISNRHREIWDHDLAAIEARWLACGEGQVRAAMNRRGDLFVSSVVESPRLRRSGGAARQLDMLPAAHRSLFVTESVVAIAPAESGELLLYDIDEGEIQGRLAGHGRPVQALAMIDDRLVSGSEDGSIRAWDLETRTCLRTYDMHRGVVTQIVPLPANDRSGRGRFVSVAHDGTIARAGIDASEQRELVSTGSELGALAISPDGRWLAAGGSSRGVLIHDLENATTAPKPLGNRTTSDLTFTPDGRRLLAASYADGRIEVFDVATWLPVIVLEHGEKVHSAQFAADGKTLVTADVGGLVRVWSID